SATGHYHVLFCVGYREEAVAVDRADVARVEPAFRVEDLVRRFGLLVVAERRDVGPARQDLAVGGDPELHSRQALPDRAEFEAVRPVEREGRAGLGEAIALEQ